MVHTELTVDLQIWRLFLSMAEFTVDQILFLPYSISRCFHGASRQNSGGFLCLYEHQLCRR